MRGLMYDVRNGSRIAKVYERGGNGFRVFVYDGLADIEDEHYFDSLEESKQYAEGWINLFSS